MENKFCECGCGQEAPLARQTDNKRGYIQGQPLRFVAGHNIAKPTEMVIRKCEYCGNEKEMYPSDAKRFRFCSRKCQGHELRESTSHPIGHKIIDFYGYVWVKCPEHTMVMANGYVKEHRMVMSEYLGRKLNNNEHVHHINGDKTDNRIENLQLISASDHSKLHQPDRQSVLNELKLWENRERDEKGRFI